MCIFPTWAVGAGVGVSVGVGVVSGWACFPDQKKVVVFSL